ncbi:unnamed protein product [Brassicogethes aeneus]|uniref:Reverse transcriptase domain-containing protein n=1 Tax=Brassicogethes aeneus TaxID=1431903 RepID=A0A9P0FKG7_BRAAE|nr:unnamed protein product [Brassicogethes aeneus]
MVYKRDITRDITNRPVALLSNIGKIVERVVYDRLSRFLESNLILNDSQNGFRKKKSTIRAIFQALCNIVKSQNLNKNTFLLCIDLSKAFDSVDHQLLFKKMELYGIRGVSLNLFKSYLENRTQSVVERDEYGFKLKSEKILIEKGVPQGSILGPLLYIIYTNELPYIIKENIIQYADDTSLIFSLDAIENADCQIRNINKLNSSNLTLETTDSVSILGVEINTRLDWKSHIDKLANSMSNLFIFEAVLFVKKNIDLFEVYKKGHCYETRFRSNYSCNKLNFTYLQNNVPNTIVKVFNKLPEQLRELSIKKVKIKLKSILIEKSYYSMEEYFNDDLHQYVFVKYYVFLVKLNHTTQKKREKGNRKFLDAVQESAAREGPRNQDQDYQEAPQGQYNRRQQNQQQ